jgi:uncharacterized protein involved in outer membrane biogenesis
MKKILIGVAAVVVVIVVAVVLLLGNIDKIVKGALEGVGSELLGVPVTVAAVEINLKSGSGQISGLTITNPPGYTAQNAFQMDMIRLSLNLGSLGKQPLVIDELNIKSPVVELEAKKDGSSNLQTLLDNIDKNSAKADKKAAEQQPDTEATPKGEPMRISFGKLAITGVTVNVIAPEQKPEKVVIPDIVEENVGEETGLTPGEVGNLIIGKIITSSLANTIQKGVTKKLGDATKGFFEGLKD